MGLHVALQFAGLAASMVAQMTFEGLLSSMGPAMDDQVALELKRLATELTGLALDEWCDPPGRISRIPSKMSRR